MYDDRNIFYLRSNPDFSSIRTLSVWRLCTNTLLGEQLTMQSEAMSKARFMMYQSFP